MIPTPQAGHREPDTMEPQKIGRLLEFWQAIDDAKPHFITDLHLHHLGRETGAHTLGVFQFELDLTSAALDQMKQQQCGQPMQLLIGSVFTHVEDLRHAISLPSADVQAPYRSMNGCSTMPRKKGFACRSNMSAFSMTYFNSSIAFRTVSISAGELRSPGATRAYCVAYGVTLATMPRSRNRRTTWSGSSPATSKHTIPADRSRDSGVRRVTRRIFASPCFK